MGCPLKPRRPARAEVVGSLLRPMSLRHAVEGFYAEGHSAVLPDERRKDRTELRALEDEAVRDAVRRQVDLGLDVASDGEFRRWMFLNSFYDAVEGFRTDNVVTFRNARGEDVPLRVHEMVERLPVPGCSMSSCSRTSTGPTGSASSEATRRAGPSPTS